MSKEEKKALKEKNEAITEEYGFCMLDGHREKIGNFRAEPPGLFRGRGEHPKQVSGPYGQWEKGQLGMVSLGGVGRRPTGIGAVRWPDLIVCGV